VRTSTCKQVFVKDNTGPWRGPMTNVARQSRGDQGRSNAAAPAGATSSFMHQARGRAAPAPGAPRLRGRWRRSWRGGGGRPRRSPPSSDRRRKRAHPAQGTRPCLRRTPACGRGRGADSALLASALARRRSAGHALQAAAIIPPRSRPRHWRRTPPSRRRPRVPRGPRQTTAHKAPGPRAMSARWQQTANRPSW
jgi:hypothetical protein